MVHVLGRLRELLQVWFLVMHRLASRGACAGMIITSGAALVSITSVVAIT
jgi:hypothetical protein